MKNLLLMMAMFFISEGAKAVCSSPISRTNSVTLTTLSATKYNTDHNTAYTRLNELPGDCVTDETVTSAKIVNGTLVNADISDNASIARSKLGAINYVISTTLTSFTTSSITPVDVTNLTVTITTNGNPVELFIVGNDVTLDSSISVSRLTATTALLGIRAFRGADRIGSHSLSISGASSTISTFVPPGSVRFFDTPTAGTYTYKIQAIVDNAATIGTFNNVKLVAREL